MLCSCGAKESEKELACDRGELTGEECIVYETQNVIKSCKSGYEYDEEKDKCVSRMTIDAKPKYICNKDYYVGDGKCISNEVFAQKLERQCISKKIKEDDKLSTTEERAEGCFEKICIEIADDGTCKTYEENKIDYQVEWSCPSGTKKVDGECHKVAYQGKSYSCEVGTQSEDKKKCIIETVDEIITGCEEGYTLNPEDNICERTIIEKAYLK